MNKNRRMLFLPVFVLISLLLIQIPACVPVDKPVSPPIVEVTSTKSLITATSTYDQTPTAQKLDNIHLRIEFQTTSDWSDLTFLSPENIIQAELISTEGDLAIYQVTPERVSISQSKSNAELGKQVGVTFDLHLNPEVLITPPFILLERGDLNESMLNIYHIEDRESTLIQEINHSRLVLDQLGRNPQTIVLDLSSISEER
jgi:hypothetical protein